MKVFQHSVVRTTLAVLPFLLPLTLHAQLNSQFNGTWHVKLDSVQLPQKPDSYLLADGRFKCLSCVEMKTDIQADGQDHAVTGSPYADTASANIVDTHTVEVTYKLKGKIVGKDKYVISPDGQTLTDFGVIYPPGSPDPVSETDVFMRVKQGPTNAHLLSGEWKPTKVAEGSANGLTATLEETPDGLKATFGEGSSFDAKFDGKQYPMVNDPGNTMVSLKRIDSNTFEQTNTRDGKAVAHIRWELLPDGKNVKLTFHNDVENTDTVSVAEKQ